MGELAKRPAASPAKKGAAKKAPAKKAVKKTPAKKAPAKKAPAKKVPAKKAVKKAPAKKAPAKKVAKKDAAKKGTAKKAAPKAAESGGGARTSPRPTMVPPALPAPPTDPLAILGLADPYSAAQLRRAWRTYASTHHPDQGGDAATFTRGRTAYELLLSRIAKEAN